MQILWYKFNIIGKYFKYRLTLTHAGIYILYALSLHIYTQSQRTTVGKTYLAAIFALTNYYFKEIGSVRLEYNIIYVTYVIMCVRITVIAFHIYTHSISAQALHTFIPTLRV